MKINFLFFSLLFLCASCSSLHSLKKNPSVEELFQHATKLKKSAYYKEALSYFKQLKNRFLYSSLVKEADLAIADIYFAQKEWPKAVQAYSQFFELYPQHPHSDKALLNLALAYFHQLPKTEDRDLSLSSKAIAYFNQHLSSFPKSLYRASAKQYRRKTLNLLARKQWMLVKFHTKQGRFKSALPYARNLKEKYSFLLPKTQTLSQKPQRPKKTPSPPQPLEPKVLVRPLSYIRHFKGTYTFVLPSDRKTPNKKRFKKPQAPVLPSLKKLKQLEKKAIQQI